MLWHFLSSAIAFATVQTIVSKNLTRLSFVGLLLSLPLSEFALIGPSVASTGEQSTIRSTRKRSLCTNKLTSWKLSEAVKSPSTTKVSYRSCKSWLSYVQYSAIYIKVLAKTSLDSCFSSTAQVFSLYPTVIRRELIVVCQMSTCLFASY